jgi:Fur family ferric uptake transcriptional regulator
MVVVARTSKVDGMQHTGGWAEQEADERCCAGQPLAPPRSMPGRGKVSHSRGEAVAISRLHGSHYTQLHVQLQYVTQGTRILVRGGSPCNPPNGTANMQRHTKQRVAIEAALGEGGRPMSPAEILEAAQAAVPSLNLATVYRTLKRLGESSTVIAIDMPGEAPRYKLRKDEEHHHHHFRCNNCQGVFCMEGCVEGLTGMLPKGFRMTGHDILLYGVCAACSAGTSS